MMLLRRGSPHDVGEPAAKSVSKGAATRANQKDLKDRDSLTKTHVIEYGRRMLRSWSAYEKNVVEKVRSELVHHSPKVDEANLLADVHVDDLLLAEARLLEELVPREQCVVIEPLNDDALGLSQSANDSFEQESNQWWQGIVDKVVVRTCENQGRAFMDRLGSALSHRDADLGSQVVDMLSPVQQQIEEIIKTELSEKIATTGEEELRMALKEGSHPALEHLEVTVHTAMEKSASTFFNDRFRAVSQRWRSATEVPSLTDCALVELGGVVRKTIEPFGCRGGPVQAQARGANGIVGASALIARAQQMSRNLENDIMRLTSSVGDLRRVIAKQSKGSAAEDAGDESATTSSKEKLRRRDQHKSADALTKAHVVEYNQKCLRSWREYEKSVLDKVRTEFSRRHRRSFEGSIKKVCVALEPLLSPQSERRVVKLLQAYSPRLAPAAKEVLERDAKMWWKGIVDRIVSRTCDNHGQSLIERLLSAVSHQDTEIGRQVMENLKPFQHRVEQHIRKELNDRIAIIGADELRMALRPALEQLDVTLNAVMATSAGTFFDDRFRKVSQRWRSSTEVSALVDSALKELSSVVIQAVAPLGLQDRPRSGGSGFRPGYSGGNVVAVLERARRISRPLEDDIVRLSVSMQNLRQDIAKQATS